jgi:hypothetical protein
MAEKIQPMALAGRRATTRTPTTMKAVKAKSTAPIPGSRAKLPLTTASATMTTHPTAKTATMTQATKWPHDPSPGPGPPRPSPTSPTLDSATKHTALTVPRSLRSMSHRLVACLPTNVLVGRAGKRRTGAAGRDGLVGFESPHPAHDGVISGGRSLVAASPAAASPGPGLCATFARCCAERPLRVWVL